ncbi:hypothetical protein GCM10027294_37700 [Marinactinospora endophytica]
MNDNDGYEDGSRRSRRAGRDPYGSPEERGYREPDPLTDPWERAPVQAHQGARAAGWPDPGAGTSGPVAERRGRRAAPGPVEPEAGFDPASRPRGRRHRPDPALDGDLASEVPRVPPPAPPGTPASGLDIGERSAGRRRRGGTDDPPPSRDGAGREERDLVAPRRARRIEDDPLADTADSHGGHGAPSGGHRRGEGDGRGGDLPPRRRRARRGRDEPGDDEFDAPGEEDSRSAAPRRGRAERSDDMTSVIGAFELPAEDPDEPVERRSRRSRSREADLDDEEVGSGRRGRRSRGRDDEEDEGGARRRSRSRSREADLDDEEVGSGRRGRRSRGHDDEEDEGGARRRSRSRGRDADPDEDEEAPAPRRARSRARGDDDAEGTGERRGGSRRAPRRRAGRRRPAKWLVVTAAVVILGGGVGGAVVLRPYLFPPDYDGEGTGEVEVVIEAGDTGADVGAALQEAGVVASVRAFTNAITDEAGITPGTYRLRSQMSADAAVELLSDPASRVGVQVTIREGLRSSSILEEISANTEIPLEELEAAYNDTEALGLPEYATAGPEGYLFPDTYMFEPNAEAVDILKQMVDRYKQMAEELDLEARAQETGYTPNEIMAMAAIIQAESGGVEDMPKISRVIYNRLEIDMELGMDSTCFYAIGEYGIALNNAQLQACRDSGSEYATYYRSGLPIGPIVSPGADAINAALDPAEGEWLFFVATDPENGITEFAETEAEFLELVDKFQQSQQN